MATLKDGETTIELLFRFNEDGPIESVRAEARGPAVGDSVISTPWEGRWSNYELRDGMRIPLDGEVAANLNFCKSGCAAQEPDRLIGRFRVSL